MTIDSQIPACEEKPQGHRGEAWPRKRAQTQACPVAAERHQKMHAADREGGEKQ